jgi:hypothetical protein
MARKPLNFDPPGEASAADAYDSVGSMSADCSVIEFVPRLWPGDHAIPWHMADWGEVIARVLVERIRAMNDSSVQHYKTDTTIAGIVWILKHRPQTRFVVITYDDTRAHSLGERIKSAAGRAGVGAVHGTASKTEWQNAQGGGCRVISQGQSAEGYALDVLVVDDPIKDFAMADNPDQRRAINEMIAFYTLRVSVSSSIVEGGAVLIIASRFHPDDPIGVRMNAKGTTWEHAHHPAILDFGTDHETAWAPDVMSIEGIRQARAEAAEVDPTERAFFARFMGSPKVIGDTRFGPATYYYQVPTTWGFRFGVGVDLAYSSKRTADWCSIITIQMFGDMVYLIDAKRFRKDRFEDVFSAMMSASNDRGFCPVYSYTSGPEIGLLRLAYERGCPIVSMQARYPKFIRAERTMKRWNDHKILLPHDVPWSKAMTARIEQFTGNEQDCDDEVDALVSVCDGMYGGTVGQGGFRAFGTRAVPTR